MRITRGRRSQETVTHPRTWRRRKVDAAAVVANVRIREGDSKSIRRTAALNKSSFEAAKENEWVVINFSVLLRADPAARLAKRMIVRRISTAF